MDNITTSQENPQSNTPNNLVWEKPVLYKEDWMNTLMPKNQPGAETDAAVDGQS